MDILELKREFQGYKEKLEGIKQTVKIEEREKTVKNWKKKQLKKDFGMIKKKVSL